MSNGGADSLTGRTQAERRAATRAALVAAGRDLFGARGYDAVSSEEIVAAAGVTRGALYHHFDGKAGLFAAAAQFLDLSLDPSLQRITLLDGPAVLGWERWHEVEQQHGLGLIEAALNAAAVAGQLRPLPVP